MRYAALALVSLLVLSAVGTYAWARRSLPQITGELQLPGLTAPVTVYRDARGVPHIEAQNTRDLYMAQGFVTAQDRLWQMEISRRAGAGRLSEVLGASQVNTDKFLRALMLRRSAERTVNALSPGALRALEAYAAGVNAFIEQATNAGRLPVEFSLLGFTPEPWTPVDSASVGKLMAYDLGGNFQAEVYRYQLRQQLGDEVATDLLPTYPQDGITIMRYQGASSDAAATRTASLEPDGSQVDLSGLLAAAYFPDPFLGSNNWVVSGKLTQSGKPLLANDPHLGMGVPAIWYQTHLRLLSDTEPLNVVGVIFPGAPGIVIGHNDHIAWGVTNTGPDVQDLYIEKRNPANPYQFEYQGQWQNATVYQEPIKVKGQPDVPFEVLVTRHGPIVSEVVGSKENRPQEALALKWTAHSPTRELEAILNLNRATNWQEFRTALKDFSVPTQNFVFAAQDGTIAYHAAGIVPIRAKGEGLVPVPGWTGEYEWTGYIPFDAMPEVVNPAEGFIVTANNKVVDDAYPHLLTHSWAEPYRAARIAEVLRSKTGLAVTDMQQLQVDYANLRARTLLPALLPRLEKASLTDTERKALALLQTWEHVDGAEQGAPLVFHTWWKHLNERLYKERLGPDLYGRMQDQGHITTAMLQAAVSGQESTWIKNAGGLNQLLADSFRDAVNTVVDAQGANPAKWAWGKFHRLGPQHQIGKAVKPLGWLLNADPLPVGGSGITVGALSHNQQTGLVSSGGVWRQVVDLANIAENSYDIVTPGQSGHFLSRWYSDQQAPHVKGELYPQLTSPSQYQNGKALLLKP